MEPMQSIGLREFRAKLHKYTLGGNQPLELTSHGRRVGFFIPFGPSVLDVSVFEKLMKNVQVVSSAIQEAGVTEEELVEEFDRLRKHGRKEDRA